MNESVPQGELRQSKRAITSRRPSSGVAVVLVVALTFSFINSAYSESEKVYVEPYDGLTLYRGLFFASGPVASKIPTTRQVAPLLLQDYKKLEGQIITYIRQKDPNFFDKFAKEIQSGDRVRVAAAIRSTNRLQREALLEATRNSKTQFASQVRRLNDPSFVTIRAEPSEPENDANVAVEVVVWVAVFVVIFVWLVRPNISRELKGLRFEQYVDEIVRGVPKAQEVRP